MGMRWTGLFRPVWVRLEVVMGQRFADVLSARFERVADGTYRVHVTVRSGDTGWERYCDWWSIATRDGRELARRVLTHPHVDEQPFTRSLDGVAIPEGVEEVTVMAHDSVNGLGGETLTVRVPNRRKRRTARRG